MAAKFFSAMKTFETLATVLVNCSSLKPSRPIQFLDLINGVADMTPIQSLMWNLSKHNIIILCSKPVHHFSIQLLNYVRRGY